MSSFSDIVDDLMASRIVFKWGGRGPNEFDCVGLYIELMKRAFGRDVFDPMHVLSHATVKEFAKQFDVIDFDDLRCGDILHFHKRESSNAAHIVTVENDVFVIDIQAGAGVVRDRLSTVLALNPIAHRLKELSP